MKLEVQVLIKKVRARMVSAFGQMVGFPIVIIWVGIILITTSFGRNGVESKVMLIISFIFLALGITLLIILYKTTEKENHK